MENLRRGRRVWLWVLLWLSLGGLIGSMVWGFFNYEGLQGRLADLPRSVVPGQVDVDASEPQTLTVFYEDPSSDGMFLIQSSDVNTLQTSPVMLTVVGPSGETVETGPYERDLRFDHDGRVLTAFATIEAPTAGIYTIQVVGDVPAGARISVGHLDEVGLVINVIAVVGLFVVSVVGLVLAVVLIAVSRGRRPSPQRADRPLVGV